MAKFAIVPLGHSSFAAKGHSTARVRAHILNFKWIYYCHDLILTHPRSSWRGPLASTSLTSQFRLFTPTAVLKYIHTQPLYASARSRKCVSFSPQQFVWIMSQSDTAFIALNEFATKSPLFLPLRPSAAFVPSTFNVLCCVLQSDPWTCTSWEPTSRCRPAAATTCSASRLARGRRPPSPGGAMASDWPKQRKRWVCTNMLCLNHMCNV